MTYLSKNASCGIYALWKIAFDRSGQFKNWSINVSRRNPRPTVEFGRRGGRTEADWPGEGREEDCYGRPEKSSKIKNGPDQFSAISLSKTGGFNCQRPAQARASSHSPSLSAASGHVGCGPNENRAWPVEFAWQGRCSPGSSPVIAAPASRKNQPKWPGCFRPRLAGVFSGYAHPGKSPGSPESFPCFS